MMEFLYFPEDKTLYLPALLTLTIFFLGAVVFMQWIKRISHRQSLEAKKLEEQMYNTNQEDKQADIQR